VFLRGVGVGRGGSLMGCGHVGGWVCLYDLGVRCSGVGGSVNAMCDWGWVPRFALKYVELVEACLLGMVFTCLASVGSAMSEWWLDAGFIAGGGCVVCVQGFVVWGNRVFFCGIFLVGFVLCACWACF